MSFKRILCLDFDGVLHSYTSGWQSASVVPDVPVRGAEAFLLSVIDEFDVHVFSSRSASFEGRRAMKSWCENWFGGAVTSKLRFPETKPPAHLSIDDRGFQFAGVWPTVEEIQAFKPYRQGQDDPNVQDA